MHFLIEDDELLENIIISGIKSALILKKEIDSETVQNKKFQKTQTKPYGDEVTDFRYKEMPNVDSNHTCLPVIPIGILGKKEYYYR